MIRMGRQNPRVMESISGLGIFLLVVKEITIKIPGIQSWGSQFDGLLKQLAASAVSPKPIGKPGTR
jgi:hypothetical protein